jgi:hypothetical protein
MKASVLSRMANTPFLLHQKQQRVIIAIYEDAFNFLRVPRRFTFHPQLVSGAAPVMSVTRTQRLLQRFLVCVSQHKQLFRLKILNNHWD